MARHKMTLQKYERLAELLRQWKDLDGTLNDHDRLRIVLLRDQVNERVTRLLDAHGSAKHVRGEDWWAAADKVAALARDVRREVRK